MNKTVAIIPPRWGSTRLPGKPLCNIKGKPMIQWVYEAVKKSQVDKVVVATDNQLIFSTVQGFGGEVVMTSPSHETGTDRVIEAYESFKDVYDFVINIQGDEPMINENDINNVVRILQKNTESISTLVGPLSKIQETDRNTVKAYVDSSKILMFTRSPLYNTQSAFKRHIGIYGFGKDTVERIHSSRMRKTDNETAEQLEQLRWADNGFEFKYSLTAERYKGIDTQQDLDNYKAIVHK